jgi:Ca2+:H+ antiporter
MTLFSRKPAGSSTAAQELPQHAPTTEKASRRHHGLPTYNHNGHRVTRGIQPDGESGRSGFHPVHFCRIAWKSNCRASKFVNVLWPFVPAAIALYYTRRESTRLVFSINYIAMLPAANLLGFAGQELARKLPKVLGILLEVTFSSVVEIVLLAVLITNDHKSGHYISVIKAAILGSILTNLLLCLGLCFFVGGFKRYEQEFHEAVSEVGSGLLLVAGFALLIPSAFFSALKSAAFAPGDARPLDAQGNPDEVYTMERLLHDTLAISRGTAILLLVAFVLYVLSPLLLCSLWLHNGTTRR